MLAIQQQLPLARVVYCSATGVSEARTALHQLPCIILNFWTLGQ